MTSQTELTLVEELENDPNHRVEMAAAELCVQVSVLLGQMKIRCDASGRELADTLGVSEGRVSQVLNGDGDLRVVALARYAQAMGYGVRVQAVRLDGDGDVLPVIAPLSRRAPRVVAAGRASKVDGRWRTVGEPIAFAQPRTDRGILLHRVVSSGVSYTNTRVDFALAAGASV